MRSITDTRPLTRAAQYLRGATDHQRGLDSQRVAILRYAAKHGYEIVETYVDCGKSGLSLQERDGLKRLLADAVSGKAGFDAILMRDVSRWGRFQVVDQDRYYEFVCRSAGIAVHYVERPHEQDASIAASVAEQLKRVIAGGMADLPRDPESRDCIS
jgi:DNA invertase Pin-like site-specific DNA recombinase